MKMAEVGFNEKVVENLMTPPLIRDNIKAIEDDFNNIFRSVLTQELPEAVTLEDAVKMKSDLFYAFAHGVQSGCRVDSAFRRRFTLPDEFNPQKKKADKSSQIII